MKERKDTDFFSRWSVHPSMRAITTKQPEEINNKHAPPGKINKLSLTTTIDHAHVAVGALCEVLLIIRYYLGGVRALPSAYSKSNREVVVAGGVMSRRSDFAYSII